MRKILYSPGFGAGWTSWESNPRVKKLMLEYPLIVKAVERGEVMSEQHPAIKALLNECEALGLDEPYLGGMYQLKIYKAAGRVHINEYDGSESVTEEGSDQGWM